MTTRPRTVTEPRGATRTGDAPFIVAVGSGKGGVGKSVVAANVATALARRGLRVVLGDLDIGGANVHVMFGSFHPDVTMTHFLGRDVESLDESATTLDALYGLKIIAGTGDSLSDANLPFATKRRLIRGFRRLSADVVVVDVGSGANYHALDFFLMGDLQLAVTTSEPTSIVDVYRFIKLAAIRKVLSAFVRRDPVHRALFKRDFGSVSEILETVERTDADAPTLVRSALSEFKPCLVVNRMSSRSHVNTEQLKVLLRKYMGSELVLLGQVPEDPGVEQSVRRFLPTVESHPGSPAAMALEGVANAIHSIATE